MLFCSRESLRIGIVAAKEKEQERQKLRGVHPAGNDLALAKEQQQHDEDNPDHFDRRR